VRSSPGRDLNAVTPNYEAGVTFQTFTAAMFQSRDFLGCDAVWCCGRIPTFRRSMLPPSSGWSDRAKTAFQ